MGKLKIPKIMNSLSYILVFNFDKNIKNLSVEKKESHIMDKFSECLAKHAQTEHINFGLSKFKNYCFKDVHTYTVDEFENFMKKITIKSRS